MNIFAWLIMGINNRNNDRKTARALRPKENIRSQVYKNYGVYKMNFIATKSRVSNRGVPPDEFLAELVAWGKTAADEIFQPNPNPVDIYGCMFEFLGPWPDLIHRKAAMLEALRVLAGFESSWVWTCGRDTTAGPETPEEMEAGAWQVSANGRVFGADLEALYATLTADVTVESGGEEIGPRLLDAQAYTFQAAMKANHPAAMEWISRLLRHTVRANGPTLNKTGSNSIYAWLSLDAQSEFVTLLQS